MALVVMVVMVVVVVVVVGGGVVVVSISSMNIRARTSIPEPLGLGVTQVFAHALGFHCQDGMSNSAYCRGHAKGFQRCGSMLIPSLFP